MFGNECSLIIPTNTQFSCLKTSAIEARHVVMLKHCISGRNENNILLLS